MDRLLGSRRGAWYLAWVVLLVPLVGWVLWPDDLVGMRLFEPARLPEAVDLGPAPPPAPVVFLTGDPFGGAASLRVNSVPGGATVFLGDTMLGVTPLELTDLRAGNWELRFHLDRYVDRKVPVTLDDAVPASANEVLREAVGLVRFQSDPSGAWIKWNGRRMAARTPVQFKNIPTGTHAFEVGKDGYRSQRFDTEVHTGRLARVVARLEQR